LIQGSALQNINNKKHKKKNKQESLIKPNVQNALNNIKSDIVLDGLWRIREDSGIQGTSSSENLHSRLAALKPSIISRQTWESLNLMLSIMFSKHNEKLLQTEMSISNILKQDTTIAYISIGKGRNDKENKGLSYEKLIKMNFKPKYNEKFEWSDADQQTLQQYIFRFGDEEVDRPVIHTQDPYYYISHYLFDDRIPPKNISTKILEMLAEHE
jgi:hypothetical protein